MPEPEDSRSSVDKFLLEQIDTVPHLEALLLCFNSRPKSWSVNNVAKALFVDESVARDILTDLSRRRLLCSVPGETDEYCYDAEPQRDRLIAAVDHAHRHELIRLSRLIHSKPSAALRAFARAFRLKKEDE